MSDTLNGKPGSGTFSECLDFVIGEWDVEESHVIAFNTPLGMGKGIGSRATHKASGIGKTKCCWGFNKTFLSVELCTEGTLEGHVFRNQAFLIIQNREKETIAMLHLPDKAPIPLQGRFREHTLLLHARCSHPFSTTLGFSDADLSDPDVLPEIIIAFRRLDSRVWLLSIYFKLEASGGPFVLKSSFFHTLQLETRREAVEPPMSIVGCQPETRLTLDEADMQLRKAEAVLIEAEREFQRAKDDLDACWEEMESQLREAEDSLVEGEKELRRATDDLDACWEETINLEVGEPDSNQPPIFQSELERFLAEKDEEIRQNYRRQMELEGELSNAQDQVDKLEALIQDLEEQIEHNIEQWEDACLLQGQRLIAKALEEGTMPLVSIDEVFGILDDYVVSQDVLTFITTYQHFYAYGAQNVKLDLSFIVFQMSKICETLFANAFSERKVKIFGIPAVCDFVERPKGFKVPVPEEDERYDITKTLSRVYSCIKKNNWSGTRNCGIAMLLFGRNYRLTNGKTIQIDNPLGISGTEDECQRLRIALYELQECRNGPVHHDLTSWEDVQKVRKCFEECFRGLLVLLCPKK